MDIFLEFLGYWISDGWVYEIKHNNKESEYRIEVCLCKDEDRERFTELAKGLGYNTYSSSDNTKIYITNKQLAKYLNDYSKGAINKRLPEWVWQLSERQSRILIKGLIAGDGTVMKNGVERFFTSSNILADQFQRLCLHAGWSSNKSKVYEAGTKFIIKGKNTQANADLWSLTINKHKNNPMVNHGHTKTQNGQSEEIINFTGNVYCIEVPSHIFYVRRNGKPVWTGNSNRHGQKGTIGAMLRGHDMPRTQNGIVPDMIMNPHAIPSRMTIAQNLEQLLGKTAALSGGIGDGTSFMDDGSPQEDIGAVLEKFGYEKYGNELLYNGATGELIPAIIFIGPVYGMRLKHMVEDKWQARGQGRKEQRTHQPTGGRGNQGGLKIGEMDRDAILGHGIAGFFKESFMERSDGSKMPLCASCGTIPVYNSRLNIAVCPMCDGPMKYIGDNEKNLELLPPLGRPKSRIVQVEIPYSTKLLGQELETYLNIGLRYITTRDVNKLQELEFSGTSSEVVKELPRLILPEMSSPAYIDAIPKAVVSIDQLRAMGANLTQLSAAEKAELDKVLEESPEGMMMGQEMSMLEGEQGPGLMNQGVSMMQSAMGTVGSTLDEAGNAITAVGQPVVNTLGQSLQQGVDAVQELIGVQQAPIMQGGLQMKPNMQFVGGDTAVYAPAMPGGGVTFAVDTSREAMAQDGLFHPALGGGRQVRRNPYRMGGMMAPRMPSYSPGGMGGMDDMGENMGGTMPSSSGLGGATIAVKKLE
jgi:hypothetical protein